MRVQLFFNFENFHSQIVKATFYVTPNQKSVSEDDLIHMILLCLHTRPSIMNRNPTEMDQIIKMKDQHKQTPVCPVFAGILSITLSNNKQSEHVSGKNQNFSGHTHLITLQQLFVVNEYTIPAQDCTNSKDFCPYESFIPKNMEK